MPGFRKNNSKSKKRQVEQDEKSGKISLWIPSNGKKYVISGLITLEDGSVHRVFIYETQEKMYENSPDYYGYLYEQEPEEEEEEEQPRRKRKPPKQYNVKKVTPNFDEEDEDEDDQDDEVAF